MISSFRPGQRLIFPIKSRASRENLNSYTSPLSLMLVMGRPIKPAGANPPTSVSNRSNFVSFGNAASHVLRAVVSTICILQPLRSTVHTSRFQSSGICASIVSGFHTEKVSIDTIAVNPLQENCFRKLVFRQIGESGLDSREKWSFLTPGRQN